MACRKHLLCQRSGYARVLPSPSSWPVYSSWCGARGLHLFLLPLIQRCLGRHLPVCIFLWWWGFLLIQMAGFVLHRPALLWMMSAVTPCIGVMHGQTLCARPLCIFAKWPSCLRPAMCTPFSTWPFSWLSVVWTCCRTPGRRPSTTMWWPVDLVWLAQVCSSLPLLSFRYYPQLNGTYQFCGVCIDLWSQFYFGLFNQKWDCCWLMVHQPQGCKRGCDKDDEDDENKDKDEDEKGWG